MRPACQRTSLLVFRHRGFLRTPRADVFCLPWREEGEGGRLGTVHSGRRLWGAKAAWTPSPTPMRCQAARSLGLEYRLGPEPSLGLGAHGAQGALFPLLRGGQAQEGANPLPEADEKGRAEHRQHDTIRPRPVSRRTP